MKKLVLIVVLIGLALSLGGGLVFAESHIDTPFKKQTVPLLQTQDVLNKFTIASDWIFTILIIFSVFIILMAAFQFVTGGPEGVAEARQKLIWAGVGIALALLAKGIPLLIVNVLNVPV